MPEIIYTTYRPQNLQKKLSLTYLGIVKKFQANQKIKKSQKTKGWGHIDPPRKIGLTSYLVKLVEM